MNYTIEQSTKMFLNNIGYTRSKNTERTYENAMKAFIMMLSDKNILASQTIDILSEKLFEDYAKYLKSYSTATETLYINVARNYFEFLAAEKMRNFDSMQAKFLIKNRIRKQGIRLLSFPEHNISKVIEFAQYRLPYKPCEEETQHLINLRDSAFLITLADTGLRIHEACGLLYDNINWYLQKAIIIGKGDKEGIIRFSDRSIEALKTYLKARKTTDNNLPLFIRHDKGVGNKEIPITTKTGRLIVSNRVRECLGEEAVGTITPHSFRHYFVTNVLRKTGNMRIAQEFARHSSIMITQRYTHLSSDELDQSYRKIFN